MGKPFWARDSIANHLSYCLHHGFDYLPLLEPFHPDRDVCWEKVAIMRNLLQKGQEAVFWMDGDSWFMDHDHSLNDDLNSAPEKIHFTGDQSDIFNGGHLLVKRSNEAIAFLDMWWSMGEQPSPRIATNHYSCNGKVLLEQPLAIALLGGADPADSTTWNFAFNRLNGCPGNPNRQIRSFLDTHAPLDRHRADAARTLLADPWRQACQIWPQKHWNAYPWIYCPGDFILHFVADSKKLMHNFREEAIFYPYLTNH